MSEKSPEEIKMDRLRAARQTKIDAQAALSNRGTEPPDDDEEAQIAWDIRYRLLLRVSLKADLAYSEAVSNYIASHPDGDALLETATATVNASVKKAQSAAAEAALTADSVAVKQP